MGLPRRAVRRPSRVPPNPSDQPWECDNCSLLFAYINAAGDRAVFKVKDFFLTVLEPWKMSTTCRRCGVFNVLEDKERTAAKVAIIRNGIPDAPGSAPVSVPVSTDATGVGASTSS